MQRADCCLRLTGLGSALISRTWVACAELWYVCRLIVCQSL